MTNERPGHSTTTMQLLERLWWEAPEPGYAAAAEAAPGQSPHRANALVMRLLVVLTMVFTGIFLAMAVVSLREPVPRAADERKTLIERIDRERTSNDSLRAELATLRKEVDVLESEQLSGKAADRAERARLARERAGGSEVRGPGVRVLLDNALPPAEGESTNDAGVIVTRDMQITINGLWQAGAEAISVNGERISSRSAIRFAGQAILVNFTPLSPPYSIEAIGEPGVLGQRFVDGPAGQYLLALADGVGIGLKVEEVGELTLPLAPMLEAPHATIPAAEPTQVKRRVQETKEATG